jgi:hypothetical protein
MEASVTSRVDEITKQVESMTTAMTGMQKMFEKFAEYQSQGRSTHAHVSVGGTEASTNPSRSIESPASSLQAKSVPETPRGVSGHG